MSNLLKSFGSLSITRSYVSIKTMHPRKFTSILENVPSRPSSAWFIYLRDHMGEYRHASGKIDLKTAAKTLSSVWNDLPAGGKEPYRKVYQAECDHHAKKLQEALNNATPKQFQEENALRKKYKLPLLKDPKRPTKPKNVFLLYIDHLRENKDPIFDGPGGYHARVSECAKKYSLLSPSEKQIFTDKAKTAAVQYFKDKEVYLKSII